jgi:dTDP-L-rhamnose 4-epimerase
LLAGKAPLVYEDGGQTRDLVHISDVVDALTLAIEDSATEIGVFNIGSGTARSVLEVAETLREALGSALAPVVVNRYREGDIRHCVADISKARLVLGYQPRASFSKGVAELAEWVRLQPSIDRVDAAISELEQRGLTK